MHCLNWTWWTTEKMKGLKYENIRFDKWFWCYYASRKSLSGVETPHPEHLHTGFTDTSHYFTWRRHFLIALRAEDYNLRRALICVILSMKTKEVKKLAPGRKPSCKKQKRKTVQRSDEQWQRNTAGSHVNFNALVPFLDQNVHVFSLSRGFSKPKRIFTGFIEYSPESVYTKSKENDSHSSWKHRIRVFLAK